MDYPFPPSCAKVLAPTPAVDHSYRIHTDVLVVDK